MTQQEVQDYLQSVRSMVKAYCEQNQLTTSEFAKLMGYHHQTMLRFMRGKPMRLERVNQVEERIRNG